MPDRVDPTLQTVQSAKGQTMFDRVFAKPKLDQLPACDHAMLPIRQLRHSRIGPAADFASTSQPAYIAG